jgi:uncharacterized membrane protein YGL010W
VRPALRQLFAEYEDCHRHRLTRLTHEIAIPLIVLHVIAMSDWLVLFEIDGVPITSAHTGIVLAGAWYVWMSPKLAALLVPAFVACVPIGRALPWWAVVAIAVFAWTIQLLGHVLFEKRSPAFMRNAIQALVGPAFFVAQLLGDVEPARSASA